MTYKHLNPNILIKVPVNKEQLEQLEAQVALIEEVRNNTSLVDAIREIRQRMTIEQMVDHSGVSRAVFYNIMNVGSLKNTELEVTKKLIEFVKNYR